MFMIYYILFIWQTNIDDTMNVLIPFIRKVLVCSMGINPSSLVNSGEVIDEMKLLNNRVGKNITPQIRGVLVKARYKFRKIVNSRVVRSVQ